MSGIFAVALGGAAGGLAVVGIVIVAIVLCLRLRRRTSDSSESSSSGSHLPGTTQVTFEETLTLKMFELNNQFSFYICNKLAFHRLLDSQVARCLTLEELSSATRNFSSINLIGHGMFGEVYKGLLHDGTMVAVKRRHSPPSYEFIQEVT
jgi:hypothetical protein